MKNKKKVWIIGLCFIIAGYFALSLCDFMYIPADKYPAVIRKKFFTDNKNMTITFVVITGFLGGIISYVYEYKKKPKEK